MKDRYVQQAQALVQLSLGEDGQIDDWRGSVVLAQIEATKTAHAAQLLRSFKGQLRLWQATHQAQVTSAVGISDELKQQLAEQIKARFTNIHSVDWRQDTKLLAGLTIQAGDSWYDGSLQHQLQIIREHIAQ